MKMKKVPKNVRFRIFAVQIVMVLFLKSGLLFGQDLGAKKVIVIDSGHGGKDFGAVGVNGIKEKDVVLDVAKAILELNESLRFPFDIYLTRYGDTLISLTDRAKLAKRLKADVFLSLHCNHSDNPNVRGVEVYASNQNSEFSDDATWLAFRLQSELNKNLGFTSRGVKFANFQVLRETAESMPTILLELGFLSNGDEVDYLMKQGNTNALALVTFLGLWNVYFPPKTDFPLELFSTHLSTHFKEVCN
ncbi:N-acetylmuramoyl-L-alanine amidase [Seonamhaeicola sp. S2-3]|uniref:N-acetylmuramoyl-L-alanine amidase family protein n=1 Tax=Seonamhaeicola sp. S2-3 TaxID=1936081 RepID=UPI0009728126|nr:N-acetylmuramoyl-L-alanine amidase [Seonamhaeicola sp. S2-3]